MTTHLYLCSRRTTHFMPTDYLQKSPIWHSFQFAEWGKWRCHLWNKVDDDFYLCFPPFLTQLGCAKPNINDHVVHDVEVTICPTIYKSDDIERPVSTQWHAIWEGNIYNGRNSPQYNILLIQELATTTIVWCLIYTYGTMNTEYGYLIIALCGYDSRICPAVYTVWAWPLAIKADKSL
jgi:hypothetical protein